MFFPFFPSISVIFAAIVIISPFFLFYDVRKRGRGTVEALLWAIGGFFFTIIVLPIWFWIRPKTADEGAGMCPICKELLIRSPKVCPHCGHILVGDVVDLSNIDEQGRK
jgi:hypothetical protein